MFWFHHESHADSFRKIAISFFVLSLILVGVVFYVSFAWATITVTPKAVPMQEGFVVDVADMPLGEKSDAIPGAIIEQEMEVKGTFQPSGEGSTIVQRARGTITLINQSSRNQPLRATTRLQAGDGTLFRTQQYVLVPAGGRLEVSVIADEIKELGDLTSTRFVLPGLQSAQQALIYGVGFSPTVSSGGVRKALTQADIDAAVAALTSELEMKMGTTLDAQSGGNSLLQQPVRIITVQPTTIAKSAEINQTVDSVTVRMVARVTAVMYDRTALRDRVDEQLAMKLGSGYDLIPPSDADISAEVETVDVQQKKASLKVMTQAARIRNADSNDFNKGNLSGLSAEAIASYFNSFNDVAGVEVKFYPFWVTSAPYLTDHINILVKK